GRATPGSHPERIDRRNRGPPGAERDASRHGGRTGDSGRPRAEPCEWTARAARSHRSGSALPFAEAGSSCKTDETDDDETDHRDQGADQVVRRTIVHGDDVRAGWQVHAEEITAEAGAIRHAAVDRDFPIRGVRL